MVGPACKASARAPGRDPSCGAALRFQSFGLFGLRAEVAAAEVAARNFGAAGRPSCGGCAWRGEDVAAAGRPPPDAPSLVAAFGPPAGCSCGEGASASAAPVEELCTLAVVALAARSWTSELDASGSPAASGGGAVSVAAAAVA